jgi:hypothetical protein
MAEMAMSTGAKGAPQQASFIAGEAFAVRSCFFVD